MIKCQIIRTISLYLDPMSLNNSTAMLKRKKINNDNLDYYRGAWNGLIASLLLSLNLNLPIRADKHIYVCLNTFLRKRMNDLEIHY